MKLGFSKSSNNCNINAVLMLHFPSTYRLAVLKGRFVLSVNQEFVEKEQSVVLNPGDEIAIIPPISGG